MKNFYTIIGLIGIFFFTLPMRIFAATEYNPDAIEVDTLPECNQQVVDNVYALSSDNHYYKCNFVPGGLRNIENGDLLYHKTLYLSFPDNFGDGCTAGTTYFFKVGFINFKQLCDSTINYFYVNYEYSSTRVYLYSNSSLTNPTEYYIDDSMFNSLGAVSNVNSSAPAYQYIKIATGGSYEYEDQGVIPELYTYDDKDFYLFYDYSMIANLDIFSNYDFTSFTDYQKLVITIGFNVLYLGVLMFFGAVLYKVIARIVRFIIG